MADAASAYISCLPDGRLLGASASHQSPHNITQALRLHGPLNVDALRESIELLIARHRSRRYAPEETRDASSHASIHVLSIQDFSGLPIDTRESEARRYTRQQADRSLDLKDGPLLRAALARLSASENILRISMHRSLCGAGILMSTVLGELSALYNARVGSRLLPFPGRAAAQSSNMGGVFGRESHLLPEARMASVREFSTAEGVAPFTTLFAAFAALLSRHSGQQQFLVGASTSNLEHPVEYVRSGFPAMLPLRVDLSGDPSFRELAQRVRRSSLDAEAHAKAVIPSQQPDAALPELRLFQVALILEQPAWETVHFSGLSVAVYELEAGTSGLELALHMEERSAGLLITADYDAVLFEPGTIQRFLGHYETLLANAIADPEGSVSRLQILTEPERRRLLTDWNSEAAREYPSDVPLQQLIEAQTEKTPHAVAVEFKDESLTYAELNARANQLAAHLRSLGVTRNTLVGVCLERSMDLVIALLAILKAGGAYLPLDPEHPDDHIGPILRNARLGVLIGRPELASRLPEFRGKLVFLDWDTLRRYPDANQPVAVSGSDLAYAIYTSGSTGQPKGVMIPRRALNNLLWSVRDWFRFGPRDVLLALTTIAFDIAGVDVWLPLLVGARMLMVERETAMDPRLLQDTIHREGVTFLQGTPAIWKLLIDSGWQGKADLQAVCTGEAMPKDLARKLLPRVGRLWNMYGPTETTIWSTGFQFSGPDDPVLIGRPIANTQVYILDENLAPAPIGVPGELYIGGDGLADGYLHQPELTAERFVADPFGRRSGARLYKTGDLARYRSDGNIECLGRNDDQIKLRGYRIEPEEIRAAILRHPAVRDAIAVLKTSESGDSRIIAYVVATGDQPPDTIELRDFVHRRLPEYMVPSGFVFLDALPLTPSGKIDRRALPSRHALVAKAEFAEPRNDWEFGLRKIWEAVLGVQPIGIRDDYFDLGGYSLTAVRLFDEIKKSFGVDLPLATLYQAPTIESLACIVSEGGRPDLGASLVPINRMGQRPPLYCVSGIGGGVLVFRDLALLLGPDQPFYGLQPRNERGRTAALTSIPEIASHYINSIQEIQPNGPYYLSGYSFGGLVAFEMARQLTSAGFAVPFLGLLDTAAPLRVKTSRSKLFSRRTHGTAWQRIREILSTDDDFLGTLRDVIRRRSSRLQERLARTLDLPLPAEWGTLTRSHVFAAMNYVGEAYTGSLTLVRPLVRPANELSSYTLGWERVVSNIEVHDVPGDHLSIYSGENIGTLAAILTDCLDRARSEAPLANARLARA
jgi:surfactin family lipopeptide synthetase A